MNKALSVTVLFAVLVVAPAFAGEDERAEGQRRRPLTDADAAAGRPLYLAECSGCHGERGNGTGPAAEFLDPRPRDFSKGLFKFRTSQPGKPPTTADILRTIERGVPGTAMPSFSFLSEDARKKIAAYVLELADLLDEPEPEPLQNVGVAPATTAATIAKGKEVYAEAGCVICHGELGRGDGPAVRDLRDADKRPIVARDFTQAVFRGGGERADVYHRIASGMDGTPMPSYRDSIDPPDLWALTDYVLSLRKPTPAKPRPADPIEAGREVAAKYGCRGCHLLDDGTGGDVGPDLRLSAQKLYPDWVRAFLKAPREYGKIYPGRVYRMPHLGLDGEEIEVMTRYLAVIGKRKDAPPMLPDVSAFPAEKVAQGKLLYMLRCSECHALGNVVETPPAKQQGPDLIRVPGRVAYEWAKGKTKMTAPDLTPEQVDAVRMFVWKAAVESGSPAPGAQKPLSAAAPSGLLLPSPAWRRWFVGSRVARSMLICAKGEAPLLLRVSRRRRPDCPFHVPRECDPDLRGRLLAKGKANL